MKKILKYIIANSVIIFCLVFLTYNFIPLSWFEVGKNPTLGATITTIAGTDTLSASRTTINTNFSNLNTELGTVIGTTTNSTITTLSGLTTASSLATVGTITSGVWNGTLIDAERGGTGSSTLSAYSVLLGSTTNAIGIVNGLGTNGQFLTSAGAGAPPTWTTSVVALGDSYAWTGAHSWTASTTFSNRVEIAASSTNPLVLNGVAFDTPSTQGASSTVLMNNASGNLKWLPTYHLLAEKYFDTGAATTTITIPAANNLRIIFNLLQASSNTLMLEFNNDTANNYTYKMSEDSAAADGKNTQSAIRLNYTGVDCSARRCYYDISITNVLGLNKLFSFTGAATANAGAMTILQGGGAWVNTTEQITTIKVGSGANMTGYIAVYGQE